MGRRPGRLAQLGFDSYDDYLRSPHWRRKRREAGDAAKWRCLCGRRATQIHHRSYDHLGDEPLKDLCAVCEHCHKAIHRLRDAGMPLAVATDLALERAAAPINVDGLRVVRLPPAGRPKPPRGRKSKKQKKVKKRKPPKPPTRSGRARSVRDANERLHQIQVRNRQRQEEARRAREFDPYRPVVGGGIPAKRVLSDGTTEPVREETHGLYEASREKRRREQSAESSGPAGAPGGSSGSTRSPDRA